MRNGCRYSRRGAVWSGKAASTLSISGSSARSANHSTAPAAPSVTTNTSAVANSRGIRKAVDPSGVSQMRETHGHKAVATTMATISGSTTSQARCTSTTAPTTSSTARLARQPA